MIVDIIPELKIIGIHDRGVANKERIAISVYEPVNMGQFGLLLGVRQQAGMAVPIRDNFYWFGDGYVNHGDWIFVYTGPGETRTTELPNTTQKLYSIHWGRTTTLLSDAEIVPILFRLDAVDVYTDTLALPDETEQKAQ